jgi:hypothetical protein
MIFTRVKGAPLEGAAVGNGIVMLVVLRDAMPQYMRPTGTSGLTPSEILLEARSSF